MQPLPTEAAPRTACGQCGQPLPAPNGSPTYVYGVGAVGYQSCGVCGAKWRYLWQEQQPAPRVKPSNGGRGRLVAVLGGLGLATIVVVAGVVLARSDRWSSASPNSAPQTTQSKSTTDTVSRAEAGEAYLRVADGMYKERKRFIEWLRTTAPATPQYLVNDRVDTYSASAGSAIDALGELDRESWPDDAAAAVEALVVADRVFLDGVDLLRYGLHSPSFIDKLRSDAVAVRQADDAVRKALGLEPLP